MAETLDWAQNEEREAPGQRLQQSHDLEDGMEWARLSPERKVASGEVGVPPGLLQPAFPEPQFWAGVDTVCLACRGAHSLSTDVGAAIRRVFSSPTLECQLHELVADALEDNPVVIGAHRTFPAYVKERHSGHKGVLLRKEGEVEGQSSERGP